MAPQKRKPAAPALARPAAPGPAAAAPVPAAPAPAPAAPAPVAAATPEPAAPELEAQAATQAPPQAKSKGKGKPPPPRRARPFNPPRVIDLPGSADELLGLDSSSLEGLQVACELRLAYLKGQRAQLAGRDPAPEEAKAHREQQAAVAAEAGLLGGALAAISRRRTSLRVANRKALGSVPERAEAVALAADRMLHAGLHRALMAEADRIQALAAQDLEAGPPSSTYPG